MAEPIGNWIGAAVTGSIALVGGLIALVRRVYASVTREELIKVIERLEEQHEKKLEELEARHEKKIDEMRNLIKALHEDNKGARHRLRDNLAAPVNNLSQEILRLRQWLDQRDAGGR